MQISQIVILNNGFIKVGVYKGGWLMQHLEGITVLNEFVQGVDGFVTLIAIVTAIAIMFMILVLIDHIKEKDCKNLPEIIIALLLLSLVCFITWSATINYERQLYEVLVSKEVGATEFTQTYKLREIKGEIYVVEFKD